MIRCQTATCSDSHEQIAPALEAINASNEALGRQGPGLATTDNVEKDKNFLLQAFPSLRKREDYLKKMSEELRKRQLEAKAAAAQPQQEP